MNNIKASIVGLISFGLISACSTIPYNAEGAKVVAEYADVADRHILSVSQSAPACVDAVRAADRQEKCMDEVRHFDMSSKECVSQPSVKTALVAAVCKPAAYTEFDAKFYDDWESKLYTAMQKGPAYDSTGLCMKAAKKATEFASKLPDDEFKRAFSAVRFDTSEGCSFGTIGGVLQQHRNLRLAHQELQVIQPQAAKFWRETLSQSIRIALTVENFKKQAAADAGL